MPGPKPKSAYARVMRRSVESKTKFYKGTPCIECGMATSGGGYPVVGAEAAFSGGIKMQTAARAVWEHKFGPLQDGKIVCHDCDNPRCVNVRHLSIGSHADKSKHKYMRGRQGTGAAKLTALQVVEIRKKRLRGATLVAIAREHGVTPRAIGNICRGKSWHGSCTVVNQPQENER